MFQLTHKWLKSKIKQTDPYYEILHIASIALVSVFINILIVFLFEPDDYLMPFLLGTLAVILCNLPLYQALKIAKVKAIVYMYVIASIAFSGINIVSVNMMLTVSYFLFLSFFLYLTTLKNSTYRLHVSVTLSLSVVLVHLSDGTYLELNHLLFNLVIVFSIALFLTLLYPERKKQRIELGILCILEGIRELTETDDVAICKQKFYTLIKHISELKTLLNDERFRELDNAIKCLRYGLLSMNFVYIKSNKKEDIIKLHHRVKMLLEKKCLSNNYDNHSSMIKEAIDTAEKKLFETIKFDQQLNTKRLPHA